MKIFKRGFTLVEMLIVVVIIGILAAALIPRLQGVQGRARDTKRKADLQQISAGLSLYRTDNGFFPFTGGTTTSLSGILVPNYLTAIPKESNVQTVWAGIGTTSTPITGDYGYTPMLRNGQAQMGMTLMAASETDGISSNWIVDAVNNPNELTGGFVDSATTGEDVDAKVCKKVTGNSTSNSWGTANDCTVKSASNLRYIYTQ